MTEQDTREKLEADVRQLCSTHGWESASPIHSASELILAALDRQVAITRRETRQSWQDAPNVLDRTNLQRIADLKAQLEEVSRAYKERGNIIEGLREQLRNDGEPFCETVKRWLTDDAPEECIECEYGCWRRMHELMAEECDSCEPMHAAEREIEELKAFCERIEKAVVNADDLTLFDMDYVPAFKLEGLPKTAEERPPDVLVG